MTTRQAGYGIQPNSALEDSDPGVVRWRRPEWF